MRKGLVLLLLVLAFVAVAAAVWGLRRPKDEPRDWVSISSTCPFPRAGKGPIRDLGSYAIEAKQNLVLRTYFIDQGEKTLTNTVQLGPEDFPQLYATPVLDGDGKTSVILYGNPTPKGLDSGKQRVWEVIGFPVPDAVYCNNLGGAIPGWMKAKGEEVFMFSFGIAKTPGSGGRAMTSIDDMLRSSKEDQVSYVAFTCSEK